jgi:hypothetical protein
MAFHHFVKLIGRNKNFAKKRFDTFETRTKKQEQELDKGLGWELGRSL